jgi:predicted transcriptional regulator
MTLTVRIDPELERQLEEVCRRQKTTKSEVVVNLVREYLARHPVRSAFETAEELGLIGCMEGEKDLSATAKQRAAAAIRAKHSR